jgi:hypothetical protein
MDDNLVPNGLSRAPRQTTQKGKSNGDDVLP